MAVLALNIENHTCTLECRKPVVTKSGLYSGLVSWDINCAYLYYVMSHPALSVSWDLQPPGSLLDQAGNAWRLSLTSKSRPITTL